MNTKPHPCNLIRSILFSILLGSTTPLLASDKPGWAGKPLATDPDEQASPCDWLEFYAEPGKAGLKLAYRCTAPVNFSLGAAYSIYLDTDGRRETGFRGSDDQFPLGADYLLQGGTLYQYAESSDARYGLDWLWNSVGLMTYTIAEEWADFILTPEQLTATTDTIQVILVGDNLAADVGGNHNDVFPDRALSTSGSGRTIAIRMK